MKTPPHRRFVSKRSRRTDHLRALWAASGLFLCGCGEREPSLDDRYEAALALLEGRSPEVLSEGRLAMASLARFDETAPQHGDAHRWMGLDLFAKVDPRRPREGRANLELAGRHLGKAIELGTDDEETLSTFAGILQQTGKPEEAIAVLSKRLERMPSLGVQLAWLLENRGNQEIAASAARIGAEHWRGVVEREPDNLEARLRWARGVMLGGQAEEALEIVAKGRDLRADRRYDAFEASLRLRQADSVPAGGPLETASVIGFLEEAHRLMPGNPVVINRLAKLSERDQATRVLVRESLERIVSSGFAGAAVHIVLGELETRSRNFPEAIVHFEAARALVPRNPFPSNLLAWCLVQQDPPEAQKAMEIWEKTIALVPDFENNPVGQRTLGAILVKLGRVEEGIAELEKARAMLDGEMREELEEVLAAARSGVKVNASEEAEKVSPNP